MERAARGIGGIVEGMIARPALSGLHLPAQARRRDRVERLEMGRRKVVALHEVLEERLPVAAPDVLLHEDEEAVFGVIVPHDTVEAGQAGREGGGSAVEIDEDPAVPDLATEFRQPATGLIEPCLPLHQRCGKKRPPRVVAPCMVAADELARVAFALRNAIAAVAADVGQNPHMNVHVSGDDELFADEVGREEIAGCADLADVTDAGPFAQQDMLDLEGEEVWRGVVAGRHAACRLGRHRERGRKGLAQLRDLSFVRFGHSANPFDSREKL